MIVFLMVRNDFLNLTSIKSAIKNHRSLIYSVIFFQLLLYFFSTLRYFNLLKVFNIQVDFKNVTAATFVANGLGLWLPGSMAFIEVIRIGLMLGANHKLNIVPKTITTADEIIQNKEQLSFRSRLTTVSLFDRLIGLWAMLFIGLIVLGYFMGNAIETNQSRYEELGLLCLLSFTLLLLTLITLLPYIARNITLRKIVEHIERFFLKTIRHGILNRFMKSLFFEIDSILDAMSIGGKKFRFFLLPIFYSFLCVFIQAITVYYCALAISTFIPFTAILATVSILAIATLFPISFGGIGGVQVIAAISMSFFGVLPQHAASAQLLQTTLNLLTISFAGLFFSKLTSGQIKSVIKLYRENKLIKNN